MKKRIISIILTVAMLLSILSICTASVFANDTNTLNKTYEEAADGEVLYDVLFGQTTGVYTPGKLYAANAATEAAITVTTSEDGKTLTLTRGDVAAAAYYWGGKFDGLKLDGDNKYTLEMNVRVENLTTPTGKPNAGLYFNAFDTYDTTNNLACNRMYGYYGTPSKSNDTLTVGGAKCEGFYRCNSSDYVTNFGAVADDNGMIKMAFEVDGRIFRVFMNGILFDESIVGQSTYDMGGDNLGLSFYLYNKNATVVVSDAQVIKGNKYSSAEGFTYPERRLNQNVITTDGSLDFIKTYDAAADGEKLVDILFNKTGIYTPIKAADRPGSSTVVVSDDGKEVTVTCNGTKNAAMWFGGPIGDLMITDDTEYTFTYKVKTTTKNGGVYISFEDDTPVMYNNYGVYGNITTASGKTQILMQYKGSNIGSYEAITPYNDADGYAEMILEVNGFMLSCYYKTVDSEGNPSMTLFKRYSMKTQSADPLALVDKLGLGIYSYNLGAITSLKDVSLYKGTACEAGLVPHDTAVLDETSVVAPNCTETGFTGNEVCPQCGHVVTAGTVVSATGHNLVDAYLDEDSVVAPLCEVDGYTGNMLCPDCDEIVTAGSVIPATGHSFKAIILEDGSNLKEEGVPYNTYYKACEHCHTLSEDTFMRDPLNPDTGDNVAAWIIAFAAFAALGTATILVLRKKKISVK